MQITAHEMADNQRVRLDVTAEKGYLHSLYLADADARVLQAQLDGIIKERDAKLAHEDAKQ